MASTTRSRSNTVGSFIGRLLHRDSSLGYILLSPGFVFLTVMMAYPFVYAVYLSFTDKQIGAPAHFTGLENYSKLLSTTLFSKTVINSLVYTTFALILKFFGGLALAVLLNRPFIGQRVVKAMMLLPWIMPTVFSTMIWSWIFHPTFSIVNEILVNKAGLLTEPIPFLRDETWAMASLIFVNVWRGVPFFGITFLAAIQSVSVEIIEASKIDGASAWVSFWRITFPMILPVVIIVMLISTIGTLGDFDLPFLLTRGGPNDATTLFALTAYTLSLSSGMIGLGAAVTMTMFPVLVLLVIASLISVRRQQQN
jgi:multiple sugar transport system permease protein